MNSYKEGDFLINKDNEISCISKILKQSPTTIVYIDQNNDTVYVDLDFIELAYDKYNRLLKEAKEKALSSVNVSYFDGSNWSSQTVILSHILPEYENIRNRFVIIEKNLYIGDEYKCVESVRVDNQELIDIEKELGIWKKI